MPPEGLAVERTTLAWARTILAVLAAALIIGRLVAGELPILAIVLDSAVVGACAFALRHSYNRYRHRRRHAIDGRTPAMLTLLVVLLGFLAIALILVVER